MCTSWAERSYPLADFATTTPIVSRIPHARLPYLQKQANTAQVYQPPDATAFANAFGGQGANMDELGLVYKHDDDVEDFED